METELHCCWGCGSEGSMCHCGGGADESDDAYGCVLVGVKVASAHVPDSSRFVSFSRTLCFFGGPGNRKDLTLHLVKTRRKKYDRENGNTFTLPVQACRAYFFKQCTHSQGCHLFYLLLCFTVNYRGMVTSDFLTCQT